MTWPGQRWKPGDLGVSGTLFSRAAGSGGAETLERILESQRNRRSSSDSSGGTGGAGLMADPPPAVFSRPSQPVTVTAGSDGPVMVSITSNSNGLTHAAVTLNGGPVMWVPVVDGAGAVQLIVAVGDVIAVAGVSSVDLMETS